MATDADGQASAEIPAVQSDASSEELFSDPESPNARSTSAVNRRLFANTGKKTPREALRDVSNQPTSAHGTQLLILEEVQKANSSLGEFADRLEALENRLATVESKQLSPATPASSSTDSSTDRGKRKVPAKVRHEVRQVYKALLEDDESFGGFDTKERFADTRNQDVVKRLVSEVTTLDSGISNVQVRDAARRFFQTKCEEEALKDKGKYKHKVTQQRRRNRLIRKLETRKAVLLRTSSLTDAQRDLWRKVVIKEFMSSEESGEEDLGNSEKRQVMLIKTLPWRAPKLDRFFKQLDHKGLKGKSKQSKQQTLPRVIGDRSTRPKPAGFADDFFGFTAA